MAKKSGCPKCGAELRFSVNVFVDAPASTFGRLSKTYIARRGVKVMGVGWDRALWYCPKGDWALRVGDPVPKEGT